jgi:putative transposase
MGQMGRVALSEHPPRAPADPYVLALEHTVPRPTGSPSTMVPEAIRSSYGDMQENLARVPLLACPAVPVAAMMAGIKRTAGHRKRIRHYHDPGHIRELTFSCYHRWPLPSNDVWRGMLAESMDRAMESHRYRLAAFVFMPAHVHLSYRVKELLVQSRSRLLERLTVHQRPGVKTFRYWQQGAGYDRNFTKPSTVLAAIDYLHHNPVRRGLVNRAVDWKWSSARYYLRDPPLQYPALPSIHSLPAEWLDGTD